MKIDIQSFSGVSPKTNPRYLAEGHAQIALNVEAFGQSIRPLYACAITNINLSMSAPVSLYRFGQDYSGVDNYWFAWPHPVDVARNHGGDTSEWTFWTDYSASNTGGFPKATNNALRGATNSPGWIPLGIPHPTDTLTATAGSLTIKRDPARVQLTADVITKLTASYGLYVTTASDSDLNSGQNVWAHVPLSSPITAASVAAALDAHPQISAKVTGTMVEVETIAKGATVTLRIRYGDVLYAVLSGVGSTSNGQAGTAPVITIDMADIYFTVASASVFVAFSQDPSGIPAWTAVRFTTSSNLTTMAQNLASQINAFAGGDVTAIASGSEVTLTRTATGAGAYLAVNYSSITSSGFRSATGVSAGTVDARGAVVTLDSRILGKLSKVNGLEYSLNQTSWAAVALPDTTAAVVAAALDAKSDLTAVVSGASVVVTTVATGDAAKLYIRYKETESNTLLGRGLDASAGTLETRQYVYTWVYITDGLAMESAPSDAAEVEVYADQAVILSGFPSSSDIGEYFDPTKVKVRVYRTTGTTFLFVDEIDLETDVVDDAWTDSVKADALGEPIPSLLWTPPPATLQGLISLPNGLLAGFSGRDLYFSEPYRPYAWPENYVLSMNAPIVGIGHVDTTVIVMTKARPVLVQGTSPDLMTQVEGSLRQACVSKRSIVSFGDAVYYAAPDGLVKMSSSGSGIITANVLDRIAWNALKPTTIHAYGHDRKYIAFYGTSASDASRGGFIFDVDTNQLTFFDSSFWSQAAYVDERSDTVFISDGADGVTIWNASTATGNTRVQGRWRSKIHSFSHPVWFSAAKLEAEAYGSAPGQGEYGDVALQIYCDGVAVFTNGAGEAWPQRVTSRAPFRLPVRVGRDWEVDIYTSQEVFRVALSQSMEQLKSV